MSLPQAPKTFQGWLGKDKSSIGNLEFGEYEPKPFEETDVDIAITHCGICGSDLHTLRSGWGPTKYPVCVGHEIAGVAVRVGSAITHIKVGDRVGVGAQSDSCRECEECKKGNENYCQRNRIDTYNSTHKTGHKSYGGYADFSRVPGHFVVKIPDSIPLAVAAPMLCGGVTVYTPLKQYGAGTERKDVGIIGIGGLGHFGLLFAKAMGANVTAISHTSSKKADAEKMGATNFIATAEEGSFKKNASTLDLIIATTNDHKMPLNDYLSLLKPHGVLVLVGAPEEDLPPFNAFALIVRNVHITGSIIGSPSTIREMLDIAASQNVRSWIQEWPMSKVNEASVAFEDGKARYRFVLVNEKHKGLAQ